MAFIIGWIRRTWRGENGFISAFLGCFFLCIFLVLLLCLPIAMLSEGIAGCFWVVSVGDFFDWMSACLLFVVIVSLKPIWSWAKSADSASVSVAGRVFVVAIILIFVSGIIQDQFERHDGFAKSVFFDGPITPASFVEIERAVERSWVAPERLIIRSAGGDLESGLAIGALIHRYRMNVEVVDYCHSACAAYIFPAGKYKYIHSNSLVTFHGNAQQSNVLELAKAVDDSKLGGENKSVINGHAGKEVIVGDVIAAQQNDRNKVRQFIGMNGTHSTVEVFERMRVLELDFYNALGVDPKLAIYGQLGAYSAAYSSYAYDSFYYSLASLERLGVTNIKLVDGVWDVSNNSLLSRLYEVVLPVQ